jgi:hypothetical protein
MIRTKDRNEANSLLGLAHPLLSGRDLVVSTFDEKREFVEELRTQWKMMWRERIDDKVRAEGISFKDYSKLFVDRGTVIIATRKFKALDFYEILQQYKESIGSEVIPPNASIGGWGKFIRNNRNMSQSHLRRRRNAPEPVKKEELQLKKCGRGWLHFKK